MIRLKTDLHLHTSEDRFDYVGHSAKELINFAARKGFKVLSITNHDTFTFNYDLECYAADHGILLIPGIEKEVERKHVLLLNANPKVEKISTFADLRHAKNDGLFVVAPHPFFKSSHSLGKKLLDHLDLFDAIEFTFFYSKWMNFNNAAVTLARQTGLPMVGDSDCHVLKYMGICHSIIQAETHTMEGVFTAIRSDLVEIVSQPIFLPKLVRIFFEMSSLKQHIKEKRSRLRARDQGDVFKPNTGFSFPEANAHR